MVLPETINFARLTPERPKGQIHGNVSSWKTQQRGFLGNPGSPAKCGQRKQLCPPKNPGCGAQLVPLVFQIKWYLKKIPHKPGKAQSDSPCSQWLLAPSCPVRDSLTNSSENKHRPCCVSPHPTHLNPSPPPPSPPQAEAVSLLRCVHRASYSSSFNTTSFQKANMSLFSFFHAENEALSTKKCADQTSSVTPLSC